MLICFEVVQPDFIKPEGIDQKKVYAVSQSRNTTIVRYDAAILCQQLGRNTIQSAELEKLN